MAGAEAYWPAVARVLRVVSDAHPDVPADLVRCVVVDAAGELAGVSRIDFPRLLHLRSSARLAAMTGAPVVIARS